MSSNYPDECGSLSEGADSRAALPLRAGSTDRSAHAEARAELRDRQTYYAELRAAVPARIDGESGDDMAAHLGDTWT